MVTLTAFCSEGVAGQKAPRLYGAGICQSTVCRVCKMGMKAGIKPVSSEILTRGDGGENIARRCASVLIGSRDVALS